jgi:hypothetical protein
MSVEPQVQQPLSDKELNFRKQEQMYQKMLAEKEARIAELQAQRAAPKNDDDDDGDDPYIDRRKLNKTLSKERETIKQQTQSEIQNAVQQALAKERQQNWLKSNPDFQEIMQHAQKFAEKDPELAETILEMPDSFERQKLVYKNIKALGLHKPPEEKPSIQATIDANRKSPYYKPTGISGAPYQSQGDFSTSGMKSSYDKMKELQQRLRLS